MGCEPNRGIELVDQQEHFSFKERHNIISRNSSVGTYSSRIFNYYRSNATEGIPFQWEMQPGMPKDPPREEPSIINLPLSPPPAILSLGFPNPSFNKDLTASKFKPQSKFNLVRVWINKKSGFRAKREDQTHHHVVGGSNKYCNCRDENSGLGEECFSSWPRCESSWSDSLSPSFSNGFSRQRSTMMRSCSSWKFSSILFRPKSGEINKR